MSVKKRGQRYQVRWRADGKHCSKSFSRRQDALAFEIEQRRAAQLGAFAVASPSRQTFGDWLTEWWATDSVVWAAATRTHRQDALKRWIRPYLDDVKLRDLGSRRVREWRSRILDDGATPSTANHALAVLSAACGAAVKDGRLPSNPVSGIRKLPVMVSRPRALVPLEVEQIRAAMPSERDRLAVSILAYAGLRPSELVALTWTAVSDRLIRVERSYSYGELRMGKTATAIRTVEIVQPLADDLAAFRPARPEPGALVIPNERGGFVDWRVWRRRVWYPACDRAGVTPRPSPYDCRHGFVSMLLHEHRSLPYVSAAVGHSSGASMTLDKYAHALHEAQLATAVSMVDAIMDARRRVRIPCATEPVRRLRQAAPGG
jgi:integrase